MPEIVDLDELVPDDIVFKLRGNEYEIPGDLATKEVFKLYRLFTDLNVAKRSGDKAAELEAAGAKLEAGLLELFKLRSPDLKELPFGVSSLEHVTPRVLELLGVRLAPAEDETAQVPPTNRAARRATVKAGRKKTSSRAASTAKTNRSKRSTGSAG